MQAARICVIPARGGSKRIPRKNIRPFCGKPMLAWAIGAARSSGLFDHVLVSTDDPEIAAVAVQHGAEAPFVRPGALADDYAGTGEVLAHAIDWALAQGWQVGPVCCLYATAALVQPDDLRRGLALLESGPWQYAFSVTEFPYTIFRSLRLRDDGAVEMFFPEHYEARSQDLPQAYHDAGQFYWGTVDAWRQGLRVFAPHSAPVPLPAWRVQDIDTPDDWARAEVIFELLRRNGEAGA